MCKDLCKIEGKPGELSWTPKIDARDIRTENKPRGIKFKK